MASKDIQVPDLGNFHDVAVIDVLVKVGDSVQVDTPLLTLETEKATMDVPSPEAGVIEALLVQRGSHVSTGTPIATVRLAETAAASPAAPAAPAAPASAAAAPSAAAAAPTATGSAAKGATAAAAAAASAPSKPAAPAVPPTPAAVAAPAQLPPINEAGFSRAHASPSVRKLARELGADLSRVRGTAQKGRISAEDLKAYVKSVLTGGGAGGAASSSALPRVNIPDFAQFGPTEVKPLTRVRRITAQRMHASWVNLPHVTQFDEADITELEQTRQTLKDRAELAGIKLTTLAFVVRACVRALQRFPDFNASLDESGENLVLKQYIHIGFAADTPQGLMVPVIRDANRLDIYETARALSELAQAARTGKLAGSQMQGGSFTISSLGGIGGTAFTPIINAPEVAILGVSRAAMRPVYREGGFVPRLMLPLSLSYDHRVIDGAAGARFAAYVASALSEVSQLIEAVP
ncbi:MAG TPA: 2-oxo acid dehydrogenase subunit E2 [Steroidobacteraceae bacterium]|nr:2-oxo acid dehydrogenase subunit E2 [Steroidobacteraceae bacterium]